MVPKQGDQMDSLSISETSTIQIERETRLIKKAFDSKGFWRFAKDLLKISWRFLKESF